MVVADEEEYRRLPAAIAVYRAACALVRGELANAMQHAYRALDLVPEADYLHRGSAAGILGLASWASGDLAAGYRSYAECMELVLKVGHISDAIGCAIALADIRITQGRLHQAMRMYERGLRLATAAT